MIVVFNNSSVYTVFYINLIQFYVVKCFKNKNIWIEEQVTPNFKTVVLHIIESLSLKPLTKTVKKIQILLPTNTTGGATVNCHNTKSF